VAVIPARGWFAVTRPQNTIVAETTAAYLAALDPACPPPPAQIEQELLNRTNAEFAIENAGRDPKHRIGLLNTLLPVQVAELLVGLHRVVRLYSQFAEEHETPSPDDNDPLLLWEPERGTYTRSDDAIGRVAALYNRGGDERFHKEVLAALRRRARYVRLAQGGRWAAVANGDLDRETLELHPFDPGRVFLSRIPVEWDPCAQSPVLHNDDDGTDWDFDSWLAEVADGDEGTEQLLWELIAAAANPQVRTNKAVGLFNPRGNNGKGTFTVHLTALVGGRNTLAASIASLSKDSTLPLIAGKSLIVSDENATNDFVRNAETVKQLATRDPILVNPKYRQPYNTVFVGTQVHSLNALPRFGDKSDSMWRRWIFIPLTARFEGREHKYIKDDYVKRPEVLRYVLRRAMELRFTGFTETAATRALLERAKQQNDPVRLFWASHVDRFVWDLLPMKFLYDLYKAWMVDERPEGRTLSFSDFEDRVREIVEDGADGWAAQARDKQVRAGSRMSSSEPLVVAYGPLSRWAPTVPGETRMRNVLLRDRVGKILGPAAKEPGPVPDAAGRLSAIEDLIAEDVARWEERAASDHGVTDPSHVRDHAQIIRMGNGCQCPPGVSSGVRQRAYPEEEYRRSARLDLALVEARRAVADEPEPTSPPPST
jgi:putative DNA primase/helicase